MTGWCNSHGPARASARIAALIAALSGSLWAHSISSAPAASPLTHIENQYADWLDATAALGTIDSGLTREVDRHGHAYWQKRTHTLAAALTAETSALDASSLNDEDARALKLMRKSLVADPDDGPPAHCAERTLTGGADPLPLQRALYACFEEIGDRIPFEGKLVVRTTALQWFGEFPDAARRKKLFFAFAPLWETINADDAPDSPYRRMIVLAAAAMRRADTSPITDAGATLGMTAADVERCLKEILGAWRAQLHGPALEPWNYWYAFSSPSRELATAIPLKDVLPLSKRFYRDLGVDLDELGVRHDLAVRPGKSPLAYADHVRIGREINGRWRPAEPRVSANYEQGGLFVLNELIHEDGHTVHDASVRTRAAFYSMGDDLFLEAFADVPAWSSSTPAWQCKYLAHCTGGADSLRELFSNVMLDAAWALFDLTMLKEPSTDPNRVWSDITSQYLNIVPHPEISWWALRVQLVRWPGYMINYGVGAVLTADIRARIEAAIGPFDAGNTRWYGWTSQHLLRYGSSIETATLLREFLGRPVSTAALLSQLQRLDAPP